MRLLKALALTAAVGGLAAGTARAAVKPHPLFTDNMVLQQGTGVAVWGKADPGEEVTVTLAKGGETVTTNPVKADKNGDWKIALPGPKAGTGYTLTIKGANAVELKNVAVGEVFVCSGQSNMEWSVNAGETPDKIKAGADHPDLRLFTVQKRTAAEPIKDQADLKHFTKWDVSGPQTVGNFSAVAYHFGVKLQKELGVPVGLIHTSWGGTPAEAWTSVEALEADPALKYYAARRQELVKKQEADAKAYDPAKAAAAYEAALAKWKDDAAKAQADGKPAPKQPARPGKGAAPLGPNTPASLYNAMIYPLLSFPVKGAIWYQGESNAGRAFEYRTLFTAMIRDWRARFGTELPFFCVQLAPYQGGRSGVDYAELRDAQVYATKALPKVGIAVITDHGNETNIHPTPKQPVGERLALSALAIAYGKPIEYSGPAFKALAIEGDKAVVTFDHAAGMAAKETSEVTGFTVAGADLMFHPAKAEIKGDTVVVSSDKVAKPVAVRYGWVNFAKPTLNLTNKAGLPAVPFRTDDAPYTTAPKK